MKSVLKKGCVGVTAMAGGALLSSQASAAIPASVTTSLTTATTDVATAGAAVLGVFVAIMAIKWLAAVIL